ncbi:MAG: TIGR03905 family TSCPD domain-containing protein [Eubacterium sp.]
MRYQYNTEGVCSRSIEFDLEDGLIKNLSFLGGCSGNAKGISALLEGQPAKDAIERLRGITCGYKETSCPDQLSKALEEIL